MGMIGGRRLSTTAEAPEYAHQAAPTAVDSSPLEGKQNKSSVQHESESCHQKNPGGIGSLFEHSQIQNRSRRRQFMDDEEHQHHGGDDREPDDHV